MRRTALIETPLDAAAILAEVARPANGATALFVGTVREVNEGRAVTGIDYSAYHAMARRELDAIAREACERFEIPELVIEHRLGTLAVGDASVIIAAGHPHRAPALDAVRFVIEELKRRVPIWKREHHADGSLDWVEATARRAEAGR